MAIISCEVMLVMEGRDLTHHLMPFAIIIAFHPVIYIQTHDDGLRRRGLVITEGFDALNNRP